jgi:hypothetical protein
LFDLVLPRIDVNVGARHLSLMRRCDAA